MYGTKEKVLHSRVFMGVKLVPLNSRIRKAIKVSKEEYFTIALLENGKIAVSSADIFKGKFERNTWLQNIVARELGRIGAIDDHTATAFIDTNKENSVKSEMRRAANDFEEAAEKLKINITSAQALHISKLTK